ncbi:hypothetical protein SDC9_120122 [bioreactor metagenome]|uniref:Uncharacterized protein n=1 Tax=bioreactor metagenome TaxID=1076179 RepID=A0A645C5S7_9ZZZZ
MNTKNAVIREKRKKVSQLIQRWLFSNEQFLNIITIPCASTDIFIYSILEYMNKGKSILYISNEDEEYVDILEKIKKNSSFRGYSYLRRGDIKLKSKFIIVKAANALEIMRDFDLVIFDDTRAFPHHTSYEIIDIMARMSKDEGKFIYCGVESIFKGKREIIIPVSEWPHPIVEPRTITTKINLEEDIPYIIYDYLKWSLYEDRKVVIYIPDLEKGLKVASYIRFYCKKLNKSVLCSWEEGKEKSFLKFAKVKSAVLITYTFENIPTYFVNANLMVFFADYKLYDYKKLFHFCGVINSYESNFKEVIYVSNEETEDMDKAKELARSFNKEAWDMGFLSY